MYTVNSIRNICLLGHSGSGKSALAESLLYMTGAISRLGGNSVTDYDPEEIRQIASAMGMIPKEEAQHIEITVEVPPVEKEATAWESLPRGHSKPLYI